MRFFVAALCALLILAPAHARNPAGELLGCMRANIPPSVQVQRLELASTNNIGDTRTLHGRLSAMREPRAGGPGLLRAVLRVDAPPNLAGAAYLVRETEDYLRDGMFVYLPAVRRVRRVTGTFADGALMGTDFSYYDFRQLQSAFGDMSAELEEPLEIDGRRTNGLLFKPLAAAETRYSHVRAWIDHETCVPLKVNFYERGEIRKQLTSPASSLKQAAERWYASELVMRDLLDQSHTVLRVLELTTDADIDAGRFRPGSFYLSR